MRSPNCAFGTRRLSIAKPLANGSVIEEVMIDDERSCALSNAQVEHFIQDGFVRIDRAFPRGLAEEGRAIMWRDLPCNPHDPATWRRPVIRLPGYGGEPFRKAANTPVLHAAF